MKRSNGNFSAYVKKTLAAEYQRQSNNNADALFDKQRNSTDSTANKQSDNKRHDPSPPNRNINVSIGSTPKLYTKE